MAIELTPYERIKHLKKAGTFPITVYGKPATVTIFGHVHNPVEWQLAVRYGNGQEDLLRLAEFSDKCFTSDRKLVSYAIEASPVVTKFFHDHYMEFEYDGDWLKHEE